jgi:hypothetical protein
MTRASFPSLFGKGYLDAVELRGLSKLAKKVDFRAGKTIFSEGDRANTVFGLSNGLVRLDPPTRSPNESLDLRQ